MTDQNGNILDTARMRTALEKVEKLFQCSGCHGLPIGEVFRIQQCLHIICKECKLAGKCESENCVSESVECDFIQDKKLEENIKGVQKLKQLVTGTHDLDKENRPTVSVKTNGRKRNLNTSANDKNNKPSKVVKKSQRTRKQDKDRETKNNTDPIADSEKASMAKKASKDQTPKAKGQKDKTPKANGTKDKALMAEKESPKPGSSKRKKAPKLDCTLPSKVQKIDFDETNPADLKMKEIFLKNDSIKKGPNLPNVADINKKNQRGETALHVACIKGDLTKINEFLEGGADPNTQDFNGWTPLHEAVQKKNFPVARVLVENGANPNIPGGEDCLTPLHEAVLNREVQLIRLLISKGASKSIKNANGLTPVDLTTDPIIVTSLNSTHCEMTDTEVMDQTVRIANVTKNQVVVTPAPDLPNQQVEKLKLFIRHMNSIGKKCSLSLGWSDKSTHLIVQSTPDKLTPASIFYYSALLSGKSIVTWDWISGCITSDDWIDEEEFMVLGSKGNPTSAPQKSRLNEDKKWPRLLKGFNIYLKGKFDKPYPTRNELEKILRVGGANVLKREPDPEAIPDNEKALPFHKTSNTMTQCTHIILYQEGKEDHFCKYNMSHVKALPAMWLFESINNFKLVDEKLYQE